MLLRPTWNRSFLIRFLITRSSRTRHSHDTFLFGRAGVTNLFCSSSTKKKIENLWTLLNFDWIIVIENLSVHLKLLKHWRTSGLEPPRLRILNLAQKLCLTIKVQAQRDDWGFTSGFATQRQIFLSIIYVAVKILNKHSETVSVRTGLL